MVSFSAACKGCSHFAGISARRSALTLLAAPDEFFRKL
jgi:hypothetical protein